MNLAPESKDQLATLPVTVLKGVGPRLAERLQRLNIRTVQDVLFHLPLRYEDRTRIVPMGAVRLGEHVVVQGEVDLAEVKFGKRRSLLVRISDGTGSLTLRFFHFNAQQQANFGRGQLVRCFGEVRNGAVTAELRAPGIPVCLHARCRPTVRDTSRRCTRPPEGVHQLTLRAISEQALQYLNGRAGHELVDWLPVELMCSTRSRTSPSSTASVCQ